MDKTDKIKQIFALLFTNTEFEKKELKKHISDFDEYLPALKDYLQRVGATIIDNGDIIELSLDKDMSAFIRLLKDDEHDSELSDVASQILTLVLYCGPISKTEIDYIRGVNSSASLRRLQLKGLIEKIRKKNNVLYKPSVKLLSEFSVDSQDKLPQASEFCKKIKDLLSLKDDENE